METSGRKKGHYELESSNCEEGLGPLGTNLFSTPYLGSISSLDGGGGGGVGDDRRVGGGGVVVETSDLNANGRRVLGRRGITEAVVKLVVVVVVVELEVP
ncbi:hypothetical protein Ancab_020806 [Ancistrocladus abbreviatus]